VFVAFDVIPAVYRLVVVIAFGAYKLFVRTRVDKFETEITFRVPTLAVESANEFKFEIVRTFRVPTLAVEAIKFVVKEFKFEIVRTFRVPTLAVESANEFKFEIVITFRVSILAVVTTIFPVVTEFDTVKFETEIDEGRSELSSARNVGAKGPPIVGPANT
jgi:hypothetical protein